MKLVCKDDFFNTPDLGIKLVDTKGEPLPSVNKDLFRHANHVHKGHRFEIGTGETYNDLSNEQKEQVGLLLRLKKAVIDNDENAKLGTIKQIDAEAAAELKVRQQDALAAKNAAACSMPAVLAKLTEVLALLAKTAKA
jgi:hypothetical protein